MKNDKTFYIQQSQTSICCWRRLMSAIFSSRLCLICSMAAVSFATASRALSALPANSAFFSSWTDIDTSWHMYAHVAATVCHTVQIFISVLTAIFQVILGYAVPTQFFLLLDLEDKNILGDKWHFCIIDAFSVTKVIDWQCQSTKGNLNYWLNQKITHWPLTSFIHHQPPEARGRDLSMVALQCQYTTQHNSNKWWTKFDKNWIAHMERSIVVARWC